MMIASLFLQAAPVAAETAVIPASMSVIDLLIKGGWVMIPLAILFALLLFIATDSWVMLRKMTRPDQAWFPKALKLVHNREYDHAFTMAKRSQSALGRIVMAGIRSHELPRAQIEEDIQVEAREVIARVESPVGYLSMIASIAPMLGFLGTIFGIINIFIGVSQTNELSISSISDGLYQKMICSAVGLLEGIIAYCAYYVMNRRLDRMVLTMDKGANLLLKALNHELNA